MVVGYYVQKKRLCEASPEERDILVKEAFNLSDEELNYLREPRDVSEHLDIVAKTIYEKTQDPISLTGANIAAVGSDEWEGDRTICKYGYKISRIFRQTKERIFAEKQLKITNTHLLRKEIGAYYGNLEETSSLWDIQPSNGDLLRSVNLPENLELDYKTSQLLGIVWADGHMSYKNNKAKLILSFTDKDLEFYNDNVVPNIEKIFNVKVSRSSYKKPASIVPLRNVDTEFKAYETFSARLNSKAVVGMLKNINFPNSELKTSIGLPKYLPEDKEKRKEFFYDKKGFLEGIVSGMGSITNSGAVKVFDKDRSFIEKINSLAKEEGYLTGEGVKSTHWSYFVRFGYKRSKSFNGIELINPRHRKEAESLNL